MFETVRRHRFGVQWSEINRSTDERQRHYKEELNKFRCAIFSLKDKWKEQEDEARGGFGRVRTGSSYRQLFCHL